MEASEGRLAARSPISNSILFTLPMQLHQMQPSLKSRYDRHSRGWNFFVSTPSTFFFFPTSPSLWPCTPPPPSPSDAAGWTTTLDRRERADKSLHGDSAFCKSCCGRRVFSFPLSLFLPLLLPTLCLYQPLPFCLLPCCLRLLHLILTFHCNLKTLFPVIDMISFASLFTTSTQSQSPFITLLISQDRQERGRQDGEDIMFT